MKIKGRLKGYTYIILGVIFVILFFLAKALRSDFPIFTNGFSLLLIIGILVYNLNKKTRK